MEPNFTEVPLPFMLADTVRVIIRRLNDKLKEHGYDFTIQQYGILHLLNLGRDVIQQDVAALTGKDKSAILRQIDILEENKLVIRVPDSVDRRKKNLVVTKLGAELHKEMMKLEEELSEELKAGIEPADLKVFINVLMQIRLKSST
jgi:DNA-binding MarR family transcriptional regulator